MAIILTSYSSKDFTTHSTLYKMPKATKKGSKSLGQATYQSKMSKYTNNLGKNMNQLSKNHNFDEPNINKAYHLYQSPMSDTTSPSKTPLANSLSNSLNSSLNPSVSPKNSNVLETTYINPNNTLSPYNKISEQNSSNNASSDEYLMHRINNSNPSINNPKLSNNIHLDLPAINEINLIKTENHQNLPQNIQTQSIKNLDLKNKLNQLIPQILNVRCSRIHGKLHLSKLGNGSNGKCIEYKNEYISPIEFEKTAGLRGGDWKRSIFCNNQHLNKLFNVYNIKMHAKKCKCFNCRNGKSNDRIHYSVPNNSRRKKKIDLDSNIKNIEKLISSPGNPIKMECIKIEATGCSPVTQIKPKIEVPALPIHNNQVTPNIFIASKQNSTILTNCSNLASSSSFDSPPSCSKANNSNVKFSSNSLTNFKTKLIQINSPLNQPSNPLKLHLDKILSPLNTELSLLKTEIYSTQIKLTNMKTKQTEIENNINKITNQYLMQQQLVLSEFSLIDKNQINLNQTLDFQENHQENHQKNSQENIQQSVDQTYLNTYFPELINKSSENETQIIEMPQMVINKRKINQNSEIHAVQAEKLDQPQISIKKIKLGPNEDSTKNQSQILISNCTRIEIPGSTRDLNLVVNQIAARTGSVSKNVILQSSGSETQSIEILSCYICKKQAKHECANCKNAFYCSQKCQISHWEQGHRDLCEEFERSF